MLEADPSWEWSEVTQMLALFGQLCDRKRPSTVQTILDESLQKNKTLPFSVFLIFEMTEHQINNGSIVFLLPYTFIMDSWRLSVFWKRFLKVSEKSFFSADYWDHFAWFQLHHRCSVLHCRAKWALAPCVMSANHKFYGNNLSRWWAVRTRSEREELIVYIGWFMERLW